LRIGPEEREERLFERGGVDLRRNHSSPTSPNFERNMMMRDEYGEREKEMIEKRKEERKCQEKEENKKCRAKLIPSSPHSRTR